MRPAFLRTLAPAKCATYVLLATLGIACATATSATDAQDDAVTSKQAPAEWATPDWEARREWYVTPQGSHLIEYDVFLALERPGRRARIASRKNLEAMGFVYPPTGVTDLTANARLPLGVVKDSDASDGKEYLGFTCAACHTSEIKIGGKRLLVDGGQAMLDFDMLIDELQLSLVETTSDKAKLARFVKALRETPERGAERLAAARTRIEGIKSRNVVSLAGGPGRLDAFTRILNEVFGDQLGGEPPKPVSQPVSFPQVWDAPRLSCVQTNCSSTNSLSRNIGESLGVFGHSRLTGRDVVSSAKVENLYRLERTLESLKSPKWNERLFGNINETKRAAGEILFKDHCATCHTEPYKTQPLGAGANDPNYIMETAGGREIAVWKVTATPYKDVGTDPTFIEVHSSRIVKKPELTSLFDMLVRGSIARALQKAPDSPEVSAAFDARNAGMLARGLRTPDGGISSLLMLGAWTASIEYTEIARLAAAQGRDPTELRRELEFYRGSMMDAGTMSYRARPLNGIAYTAPFGIVGAWPTLADVLAKVDDRPKTFPVRMRSFDPNRVGLDISPAKKGEKVFTFDTSNDGNHNFGHVYGVDLLPDQKEALIEYMKSI